jgi:riboflavin kinase/FMN adenylyltransferase
MKVTWLDGVLPRARRVAIGQFDGVHVGHRALIAHCDTVLTFEPHPQTVLTPDRAPLLLSPLQRKAELVASLGVRELVVVPFDPERAGQSAEDFVAGVLLDRLGTTEAVVGQNFRFGHRAQGDGAMLVADPRLQARVAPLVHADGAPVSSTRIRGLIAHGDVEAAGQMLGSPVYLEAKVRSVSRRSGAVPVLQLVIAAGRAMPPAGLYDCHCAGAEATLTITSSPVGHGLGFGRLFGDVDVTPDATVALELLRRRHAPRVPAVSAAA